MNTPSATTKSGFGLLLLLFSYTGIMAQAPPTASGKLSGKIINDSLQPVAFASVNLLKAKGDSVIKGSLSNDKGEYFFDLLPAGSYKIAITINGYAPATKGPFVLTETSNELKAEDVRLAPGSNTLAGVTVTSKKPLIERKLDKVVMNVENSALATGNSALDILARAPGVAVDQSGNISMKGKQGVNVMIDGKLTYLSSDQLASLLRSTQGNAVQSIELIANPSAKYDASGSSGIINIKLKKNKSYGTNGSVSGGLGLANYWKENAGLTFNHREKKLNLYGSYYYDNNKKWRNLEIDRVNQNGNVSTAFAQQTRVIIKDENNTYKAGLDYFISDKTTIGLMVNGSVRDGNDNGTGTTGIGSSIGKIDSVVVANNPAVRKNRNIAYNFNLKSVLDSTGKELNVDLDYVQYNNRSNNIYNNQYYTNAGALLGDPVNFRINTPATIKIWAGKIDYTQMVAGKVKMDVGVKSSFVRTDNNLIYENQLLQDWKNDPSRSNHFVYDENIQAGYINLSRTFKTTGVQVGLRAEHTRSKGNSVTLGKVVDRKYINFFPSIFVSQELSKSHELGFSFSRRVDRPNYADLNPFVYNFDLYTFAQGNPYLNPQFTNNAEISYTYNKTLNLSLGYSHTSNAITEVTLPDTANRTLYVTKQNLATQQSVYLGVSYPLQITKWWSADNNLNIYYNKFTSPNLLGAPFNEGLTTLSLNIYQSFTLDKNTSVEASFLYLSPSIQGTYRIGYFSYGDLGIKRTLLQNKAVIKLSLEDVFNTHRERIRSVIPGQQYHIYQKYETRIARLSFSYRFGSNDIKAARKRRRSTTAEENRVN